MKNPGRGLSFTCNRRTFFRALVQEVVVTHDAFKGKQSCRLIDLADLADDQLAQVCPLVSGDYEILVDQDYVWARYRLEEQTPVKLFATKKENLTAFNMFNGYHSLDEIARCLAQEMAWDEPAAFVHSRDLFFSLVRRSVCLPKAPLESW